MKKLILPLCMLAVIACNKKDDDTTSPTTTTTTSGSTTSVAFTQANLVGTWDYNKDEAYDVTTDSLLDTQEHPKGELMFMFNADNSTTVIENGDFADYGNYTIAKKGNKDYLVFLRPGMGNDSMEVVSFTKTSLVLNDKMYQQSQSNDMYAKMYLTKH